MIYTGIGARKTPELILRKMRMYADSFGELGITLRSGGADGADTAFEVGCDRSNGSKEIYLPWKGFNDNPSPLFYVSPEALEYAADIYGPSWKYIAHTTKLFMARNMYQVLGETLDKPTDFVLCWTPDGCDAASTRSKKTGGTGQAIACASELDIPVFNLFSTEGERNFIAFLKEIESML